MTNLKTAVTTVMLLFLFFLQVVLAQPDSPQHQSAFLAGSIMVEGHSLEYLRGLTDGFGGRVSGSSAYQKAAEWAVSQFRAAGINNVKLESFTMPNGWERVSASARMIAPLERPLQVQSYGWAPSTLSGGLKGEIVYIPHIFAQGRIKIHADKIKGKIVLIDNESFSQDSAFKDTKYMASKRLLKELGAVAILVRGSTENNVTTSWDDTWGGTLEPLPVLEIGMEDGMLVQRLLGNGPVTIELQCENKLSGPTVVNNVVAEIRGSEQPDEWILVGAHLDSWDQGAGAQDNGAGCAMVLESARAIARLNAAPRRSIRFVLWGGEEQGMLGSSAYVLSHASEMSNCIAVLNTSSGAGRPQGWIVRGNDQLTSAMVPVGQSLAGMGGDGLKQEVRFEELSDWIPFLLHGVPSLDLWTDMTHYLEYHHRPSDTFDKVNAHNLALGTAIVAVTAYTIAEQPQPVSPHLDQAAIDGVLKRSNVYETIKDLMDEGVLP
jgi:carboxypeptidase Q